MNPRRGTLSDVKSVFSAKVKDGVIVVDDLDLPEGATVTVFVEDPADDYAELTPEEEAELEASIAEADRGEGVDWQVLRAELRRGHA
ncbi:MAG TPA: hypothetical protein VM820_22105 [Vicinamibacterales bacterium]|nr:hypothetical protein [Vicinamibacterales bacterium]